MRSLRSFCVRAGELARLHERGLRLVERAEVVVRLRDDRPRDALLGRVHRRLAREHHLRHLDRARQILRRENVFGGAREHAGAVRMLRERLRELHARVRRLRVPLGLRRAAEALFFLLVRHQRGIAGRRRLVVLRIEVRRALVFRRGIGELLALEQRLGEQVVGAGGIRIVREGLQVIAIPLRGFLEVLDLLRLLRRRMEVRGDVLQVGLQLLRRPSGTSRDRGPARTAVPKL